MLGDTITLNISLTGTPEEKILNKVNQDGYSAEYRLKDDDREHVVLIRHTKENAKLKGKGVDRHNMTYTQNIFPTEISPLGETIQAYGVIRVNPERPTDDGVAVTNAVTRFVQANAEAIINWES